MPNRICGQIRKYSTAENKGIKQKRRDGVPQGRGKKIQGHQKDDWPVPDGTHKDSFKSGRGGTDWKKD